MRNSSTRSYQKTRPRETLSRDSLFGRTAFLTNSHKGRYLAGMCALWRFGESSLVAQFVIIRRHRLARSILCLSDCLAGAPGPALIAARFMENKGALPKSFNSKTSGFYSRTPRFLQRSHSSLAALAYSSYSSCQKLLLFKKVSDCKQNSSYSKINNFLYKGKKLRNLRGKYIHISL